METQTEAPKQNIILPKLTDGEILGLLGYAEAKLNQQRFVPFCTWLQVVLRAEIERRNRKLAEPEMPQIPQDWSNSEAGDSLLGAYCLSRSGITMAQAIFVDEVLTHIVADCSARLDHHK